MSGKNDKICMHSHDFALVISGVHDLNAAFEDALFESGCDDATVSVRLGQVYIEFSREAPKVEDAILSAIRDVHKAAIGAKVIRVDTCDLVTPAEIARKIGRSRQLVGQYMSGERGPGGFPAPMCHLSEGKPLWQWCSVSHWLVQNNIIRPEEGWNAEVTAAVNTSLEAIQQRERNPDLVKRIEQDLVGK